MNLYLVKELLSMIYLFIYRPDPGEPSQIKCSCLGSSVIQIGQELASEIQVTISDKYGNPVSDVSNV